MISSVSASSGAKSCIFLALPVAVFPNHASAHTQADTHGGEAEANFGVLLKLLCKLIH